MNDHDEILKLLFALAVAPFALIAGLAIDFLLAVAVHNLLLA